MSVLTTIFQPDIDFLFVESDQVVYPVKVVSQSVIAELRLHTNS